MHYRIHDLEIYNDSAITATANGDSLALGRNRQLAVQVTWTSTVSSASALLQASNDGTNWVDITGASQTILNNSGTTIWTISDANYKFIRPRLVYTSGSVTTLIYRLFSAE